MSTASIPSGPVIQPSRVSATLDSIGAEWRHAAAWHEGIDARPVISVFGSARTSPTNPSYELAAELGSRIAQENWQAITGGGPGIMQAVRDGSGEKSSLAARIEIPGEVPDTVLGPHQSITVSTFALRKVLLTHDVDGFVFLPGGVGTLDELGEVLVLIDTGKMPEVPIILLETPDTTYWEPWLDFLERSVVAGGLVDRSIMSGISCTNSAETAVSRIRTHINESKTK